MRRHLTTTRAEGQALVLVALAFVLLVAALGLALDGANAFGQRRLAANAADAAAIAGARALIAQKGHGSGGTVVNDTIDAFLNDRHDLHGAQVIWSATYVDRFDPEGSLGPVTDGSAPLNDAEGVHVDVEITFPTYFMGVFGQRSLSVSGRGVAVYGPLGTAIGQDLAPLALSLTGWEILQDEGTVRLDMRDKILPTIVWRDPANHDMGFDLVLPDDVINFSNIKHVSFAEVAGAPVTGNDCLSTTAEDSLTYWWCQGSPNKLTINRELPTGAPNFGVLNTAITWRQSHRNLLVLPVYADDIRFVGGVEQIYQRLVLFAAVEIEDLDTTDSILTIRHLPDYTTSGAMVGEGSGVETGVWAVNLTR